MIDPDARQSRLRDRRRAARGGRRDYDRPGRHPMLLVAESYDEVRRSCVRYLSLFGFLVREAQNASEAIATLRCATPKVILAEPRLPMLSAARLWEQVQADPRTRSTPIILLVAEFDVPEDVVGGLRPAAVLHKPFHLTSLATAVRRALRARTPVVL
jgi:two-component system, OmpR family, phosphate regulon response regulator PhoB